MTCRLTGFLNISWLTEDGDSGEFDVFVQSDISEAIDEVDQLSEVVEERLVCLFVLVHLLFYLISRY